MTENPQITCELVSTAILSVIPDRKVLFVEDKGVWVRHLFKVGLDNGEVVFLKEDINPSDQLSEKEAYITELLHKHGLPAPHLLACGSSCTLLPVPFIVQEFVRGQRLGDLLKITDDKDRRKIYRALGQFYKKLHAITNDHAGWIQGSGKVLPFSPTRHQYEEVILKIGGLAVRQGLLGLENYDRLKRLWSENLDWLQDYPVSLVVTAFHWTISLEKSPEWHVTRLTDLHDALFWDAAWDLSYIKYPVFQEPLDPVMWAEFVSEYGQEPVDKRLRLYRTMQWLDAAMGNYMEPQNSAHERWRENVWDTFQHLLDI